MKSRNLFFGTDQEREEYLKINNPNRVKWHIIRDINCLKELEHQYKALIKFIDRDVMSDPKVIRDYCQRRLEYANNQRVNVLGKFVQEQNLIPINEEEEG